MLFQLVAKLLYVVLVVVEIILALRFVFTLLGANQANQFVRGIYTASTPLIKPFSGIVSDTVNVFGFRVEIVTLIALVILTLIAYGLMEVIHTFDRPHE